MNALQAMATIVATVVIPAIGMFVAIEAIEATAAFEVFEVIQAYWTTDNPLTIVAIRTSQLVDVIQLSWMTTAVNNNSAYYLVKPNMLLWASESMGRNVANTRLVD